jgi:FkbM family methyltransferase
MKKNMTHNLINKLFKKAIHGANNYYSQCGEDIIAARILGRLKIAQPNYLDIGANHPVKLNNTYKFYERGCNGVLIEPNPFLYNELKKQRPRDKVLNIGIGIESKKHCYFYVMSNEFLSTFSEESAKKVESYGKEKIERILNIPLKNINQILTDHFDDYPNFVSLDIEGNDFEILKTLDFSKFRPEVFCIETITFTQNNTEEKVISIFDFMEKNGYMVYGDTYINTIFVDKIKWKNR